MSGALLSIKAFGLRWSAGASGARASPSDRGAARSLRPGQTSPSQVLATSLAMSAGGEAAAAAPDRSAALDPELQRRFRDLMLPHLDAAYTFALYLARNDDVAQDVVQDAYVRALRAFSSYRGENAKAWLLAIVRNVFLTSARARASGGTVSLEAYLHGDPGRDGAAPQLWDPDQDTPETALVRSDESGRVRDLIEALPEPFRETLVLRELEELSYREIAAATGSPIGTVMSRLARARQMLEQAWRRRYEPGRERRA